MTKDLCSTFATSTLLLHPADLAHLEHARSRGNLDSYLVVDCLADESSPDRARDREEAPRDVGRILADQRVDHLFAGVEVLEDHRGAEANAVARKRLGIDDLGARELVLEHPDAGLEMRLPLLGCVVLGILREIA